MRVLCCIAGCALLLLLLPLLLLVLLRRCQGIKLFCVHPQQHNLTPHKAVCLQFARNSHISLVQCCSMATGTVLRL
jgi:hypothetical protein